MTAGREVGTALVTGAAGFIGSHLCDRLLAEGWRVVGVDDLSAGRGENLRESAAHGDRFTLEERDIRSADLAGLVAKAQPEAVFHLAAQAGVRPSLADPRDDAERNVIGTLNLLEAARAAGVRRVVYAASGGTLYGEPDRLPVDETAAVAAVPASPYGISKKVVLGYLAFYRAARGLEHVSLALANVYGPRQDPVGEAGVVAIFGSRMLRGERPTIFGDGAQTRDFVYVADAADAFLRAAHHPDPPPLVNVGTGRETSVNELYRMIAAQTGYAGEPAHGPLPPGEIRRIALDVTLAARALDWRPVTSLEDGLRATIDWLRAS